MSKVTIFLDLDGVCCNFVAGVCDLFGVDYPTTVLNWPADQYLITDALRITYETLWEKIDAGGDAFWSDLREYPWFDDLLAGCKDQGEVVFLSSPSWNPDCVKGKLRWLQDRYGKDFRNYVFTQQKYRCAKPGTVLIDDNPTQVQQFADRGGKAVLFSQPWNMAGRLVTDDRVKSAMNGVDLLLGAHTGA